MPTAGQLLDLDVTGVNPANRIIDEPHTLSNTRVRSLVPMYGPVFAESVIVKDGARVLVRGSDYQIVELHSEATLLYSKEIASVILILDTNVSQIVSISYQALGGRYLYNATDQAIGNLYQTVMNDNRPIEWKNVFNKPTEFNPTVHRHLIDDIYGFEPVVDYLERIKNALNLGQVSLVLEILNKIYARPSYDQLDNYLPTALPKMSRFDAIAYLLSKNKVISNIYIKVHEYEWKKGLSHTFTIDCRGYPAGKTLFYEFFIPNSRVTVITPQIGTFVSNNDFVDVTIYLNTDPYPDNEMFYIGVKENRYDPQYLSYSYFIDSKVPYTGFAFEPFQIERSEANQFTQLDILEQNDSEDHRLYYLVT